MTLTLSIYSHNGMRPGARKAGIRPRGPQQAEILDTDAEIRAEIFLKSEIRNPKQYFSDYFRENTEIHIT